MYLLVSIYLIDTISFDIEWKKNMVHTFWTIKMKMNDSEIKITQQTFTCSNSTIETLEKSVKYVQINNKNTRTTSTLNIIHTFFLCSCC